MKFALVSFGWIVPCGAIRRASTESSKSHKTNAVCRAQKRERSNDLPSITFPMSLPMESNSTTQPGDFKAKDIDVNTLEKWCLAYREMEKDAVSLGIPRSAIPQLPANPDGEDIRAARDLLSGIIASFLSSGL